MPLATERWPSDALVAGRFGFPQIANRFVSKARQQRFAGAAPGENLKRMLSETSAGVNRGTKILKVIGPCQVAIIIGFQHIISGSTLSGSTHNYSASKLYPESRYSPPLACHPESQRGRALVSHFG